MFIAVKVRVPQPLQKLTAGKDEIEVESGTIMEVIENIEKVYPGIKERLCKKEGGLNKFINFFVNEIDIRFIKGDETELKDGDDLSIVAAIAGGKQTRLLFSQHHDLPPNPLPFAAVDNGVSVGELDSFIASQRFGNWIDNFKVV